MSFWDLDHPTGRVALAIDSSNVVNYGELAASADTSVKALNEFDRRTLGFLLIDATRAAVDVYLGALRSRQHVPLLLQPGINSSLLDRLVTKYCPDWIAATALLEVPAGYRRYHFHNDLALYFRIESYMGVEPNEHLALLLCTSGSTGSEKLVRISYDSLAHNAASIAQYLKLTSSDRAVSTLPLAYSFGMSILNSHLEVGGSMLLTQETLLSRSFWDHLYEAEVTSVSGVPSQFQMLQRAGIKNRNLGALRMLTQAGGRLSDKLINHFNGICQEKGLEFYVMYGQTEASPRISYVPPYMLSEKVGSIGVPIPGGKLSLDPSNGELIYSGPNVMLGYAESRSDLAKGDDCYGILRTGDLASMDEDGFFYLTGRIKRFIKLSGTRVNLDHLEASLSGHFQTHLACVGEDDNLAVVVAGAQHLEEGSVIDYLRSTFNIDRGYVKISYVVEIPLTDNGKIDYQTLKRDLFSKVKLEE